MYDEIMYDEISPDEGGGTEKLSAVVESSVSIRAERLEQGRKCFELKLAGMTHDEIAGSIGVSRSTVIRRLNDYRELYSQQLVETPRHHLLAEELGRIESLEMEARKSAETATTPSAKNAFLRTALSAVGKRNTLLLEAGIIPREPALLVTAHVPPEDISTKHPDDRTDDELRRDLWELLKQSRRM